MTIEKFEKPMPRSAKKAVEFLAEHFRYPTMSHHNLAYSYAHCMKICNIGFPKDVVDKVYDLLLTEERTPLHDAIDDLVREFDEEFDYSYQAGFNGRSGGYLVLYNGGKKDSGYRSRCPKCGGLNYAKIVRLDSVEALLVRFPTWVPDITLAAIDRFVKECQDAAGESPEKAAISEKVTRSSSGLGVTVEGRLASISGIRAKLKSDGGNHAVEGKICGRCHEGELRNLDHIVHQTFSMPGQSVGWSAEELRSLKLGEDVSRDSIMEMAKVVKRFDRLADDIVAACVDIAQNFESKEETIMVPKKITVWENKNEKAEAAG